MKIVEVVAALIWDGNKFLACQRPANKARALMWEFIGGKVESGESLEEALKRECKEEMDISIEVGTKFYDVIHEYDDITIHLTLFNCLIKDKNDIKLIEHNDYRWITKDEVDDFEFCPADKEILGKIKNIPSANEIYRHFKGNVYSVISTAIDTTSLDLLVIYKDVNNENKVWARSFNEWAGTVNRDGKEYIRFSKI